MSPVALSYMVKAAESTDSASLLVLKDGHTVVERYFAEPLKPVQLRSVTKMFTGLAIGLLIEDGTIKSLDLPISTWFPAWSGGVKGTVTLRHLLTHTSGIEHDMGDPVLSKQKDMVSWVLSARDVKGTPGAKYDYNNDAVELLSGIVRLAAGQSLADYVQKKIFDPMAIERPKWFHDEVGNTMAYAGLSLNARDLAKFGQMLLDGGAWRGTQLVPKSWVELASKPNTPVTDAYGYLMEMFPAWEAKITKESLAKSKRLGFSATSKLSPLVDVPMTWDAMWMEIGARLEADERAFLAANSMTPFESKKVVAGFGHTGSFAQYLVVLPEHRIVGVRQVAVERDSGPFMFTNWLTRAERRKD